MFKQVFVRDTLSSGRLVIRSFAAGNYVSSFKSRNAGQRARRARCL